MNRATFKNVARTTHDLKISSSFAAHQNTTIPAAGAAEQCTWIASSNSSGTHNYIYTWHAGEREIMHRSTHADNKHNIITTQYQLLTKLHDVQSWRSADCDQRPHKMPLPTATCPVKQWHSKGGRKGRTAFGGNHKGAAKKGVLTRHQASYDFWGCSPLRMLITHHATPLM